MATPADEVGGSTSTGTGPPDVEAPGNSVPPTGVVGLGDIGRGLAGTLRKAGVDLTVCDVRPEAAEAFRDGARIAESPAELADHCDVVLVAVVDDAQVRTVVTGPSGVLSAGRRGGTVVVISTVTTDTVAAVADGAERHGVSVVDCGVSGGPGAAADGQLVCMVGGDPEAVERVRPVLDVVGSLVLHMGPLGAGLSAKLARNLVQYGSWLAAYEAQVLAEAAGIPLALLAQAIRESDKRIGGAATLMFRETAQPLRADLPGDVGLIAPMAAASRLAHKDLRAALSLATSLGVELPLALLTDECCDRLFGVAPDPIEPEESGDVAELGGMPR
jgi:3-hydroxyisobutyrate dehydrogenase-like beta-hydroxyacid dehydrogenase